MKVYAALLIEEMNLQTELLFPSLYHCRGQYISNAWNRGTHKVEEL
jgi:hypothetical protein